MYLRMYIFLKCKVFIKQRFYKICITIVHYLLSYLRPTYSLHNSLSSCFQFINYTINLTTQLAGAECFSENVDVYRLYRYRMMNKIWELLTCIV